MPDRQTATNVRTGEQVTTEVPTADEAYIAALRRERVGYVTRGLDDRVKAVDAELGRLEAPGRAPMENAAESKPRRTASSRTGKSS